MLKPAIEVRDIRYAYEGAGRDALSGVSFAVFRGEKTAIVGPNGSGKSTLLLCLAGAFAARSGEIRVNGERAGADDLRKSVGLIFQDPDDQLIMPSVIEDVAFGLAADGVPAAEAQERALETLSALGAARLAGRAPHKLSGGEKRMAALAGILVTEPDILVLDEPTSSLDPRARRRVIDTLSGMDKTAIIATHDLDMALDVCGRAIILHNGTISRDGPLPDMFRDSALLSANDLEPPLRWRV